MAKQPTSWGLWGHYQTAAQQTQFGAQSSLQPALPTRWACSEASLVQPPLVSNPAPTHSPAPGAHAWNSYAQRVGTGTQADAHGRDQPTLPFSPQGPEPLPPLLRRCEAAGESAGLHTGSLPFLAAPPPCPAPGSILWRSSPSPEVSAGYAAPLVPSPHLTGARGQAPALS